MYPVILNEVISMHAYHVEGETKPCFHWGKGEEKAQSESLPIQSWNLWGGFFFPHINDQIGGTQKAVLIVSPFRTFPLLVSFFFVRKEKRKEVERGRNAKREREKVPLCLLFTCFLSSQAEIVKEKKRKKSVNTYTHNWETIGNWVLRYAK
jgi:hypothetical protein